MFPRNFPVMEPSTCTYQTVTTLYHSSSSEEIIVTSNKETIIVTMSGKRLIITNVFLGHFLDARLHFNFTTEKQEGSSARFV